MPTAQGSTLLKRLRTCRRSCAALLATAAALPAKRRRSRPRPPTRATLSSTPSWAGLPRQTCCRSVGGASRGGMARLVEHQWSSQHVFNNFKHKCGMHLTLYHHLRRPPQADLGVLCRIRGTDGIPLRTLYLHYRRMVESGEGACCRPAACSAALQQWAASPVGCSMKLDCCSLTCCILSSWCILPCSSCSGPHERTEPRSHPGVWRAG